MLDEILRSKREELAEAKARTPSARLLEQCPEQPPPSLKKILAGTSVSSSSPAGGLRIIAEVKYKSPSEGLFPCDLSPADLATSYHENGAAGISVLTEKTYFNGDLEYLREIRESLPDAALLRKDFIFDPYQVLEALAYGASAYLLIAACLDRHNLAGLIEAGGEFLVEPLVEVHNPWELEKAIESGATLLGVNNRNLQTFEVDIRTSFELARMLEGETGYTLISESGLSRRSQLLELQEAGFCGFLIGSSLVKSRNPGEKLAEFLGGAREEQ